MNDDPSNYTEEGPSWGELLRLLGWACAIAAGITLALTVLSKL